MDGGQKRSQVDRTLSRIDQALTGVAQLYKSSAMRSMNQAVSENKDFATVRQV